MSEVNKTVEPQYDVVLCARDKHGISEFGLMANESWNEDPKRTLFTLARYKFVAKMLEGRAQVLEVGCADAFATRLVQQAVGGVTAVDFDPLFIADVARRQNPHWPLTSVVHDMLNGPVPGTSTRSTPLTCWNTSGRRLRTASSAMPSPAWRRAA
jgi:hypothetical protein